MESLRNVLSLEWWRNFVSGLTFADVSQRWQMVKDVAANPQSNPQIALLALTAVLILILIVVLSLMMLYFARVAKQDEEYELLDDDGNVVGVVSKREAEALMEDRAVAASGDNDRLADTIVLKQSPYITSLLAIGVVAALLVGANVGTRTDVFCGSCHETPHDKEDVILAQAHKDVSCVDCHEGGNIIQSLTVNLMPRAVHSMRGFTAAVSEDGRNVSGYGSVSAAACGNCHMDQILDGIVKDSAQGQRAVRMSHAEPVKAGMSCSECHIFTSAQESRLMRTGMQSCIYCHNGAEASIDCSTCHSVSRTSAKGPDIGDNWAKQLIHRSADSYCYDCHDPKPCDDCHGTRIPHSEAYMDTGDSDNWKIHADDYYRIGGAMCYNCHYDQSVSGAGNCNICHGDLYMPSPDHPSYNFNNPR